jgi:hypothetical protein
MVRPPTRIATVPAAVAETEITANLRPQAADACGSFASNTHEVRRVIERAELEAHYDEGRFPGLGRTAHRLD